MHSPALGLQNRLFQLGSGSWKRVLLLLAIFLLLRAPAGAQVKEIRRVLIINELGLASPTIALVDGKIRSGLEKSPYQIELYSEYLETTLFPDPAVQQEFRQWYIHKYRDRKPDVIIAVGPSAIDFMMAAHQRFFPATPVIFCVSSREMVNYPKLAPEYTGIWEMLEPAKTLEVALKLQPGTKHVVVVGGVAAYDRYLESIIRNSLRSYQSRFDITYLTDLDMPVLLKRLRQLPKDTVVLYAGISQDAGGSHYIDVTQSVPMVTEAANAPVFGTGEKIGQGILGGYVTSYSKEAELVAADAVRILNGEKPPKIPVLNGANVYIFDSRALRRWGMKESNLPPDSILLNRQPSFWEMYKRYALAAIFVLLAQTVAIFALLWQRAQRKKARMALLKSEEKFAKAFHQSPLSFTLASLIDYRLLEVNDTFERYTGWTRDEVIGLTSLQIKFWVDMKQRSTFIEQLRTNGGVRNQEILFRKKDGEVRTGVASSELINVNGEPCALSLMSDVSEAKQAENALYASEERLRLAQQAARIGTFEWNIRTGVNTWTPELEAMYGLPLGGFGGTQAAFENLVHPDDRAGVVELVDKSLKAGQPIQGEWRVVWPDGSIHWITGRWQVFMDESGEPSRMVGVNIDVTDRKRAEEVLSSVSRRLIHAQEQERARIARELHDDINQRVALLAIDLDALQQHAPDLATELVAGLDGLRLRLLELGSEIQGISHRLHSSKLEYLGLVAACKSFCNEITERHKVVVDFTAEEIPSGVPQDVSLCLFRVLQEALTNAIKHSGTEHFEAELRGLTDQIQLIVRDYGVGFEGDAAMNTQGLGIISMRERVSLVGGTLLIRSKPMCGTEITVSVPVVMAHEVSQTTAGAA